MVNRAQEEIIKDWGNFDVNTPLLSIQCCTYNQEKYIAETLDGFLLQKTTFPFEVIVHDDASTDRTADIIREYEEKYPDIIKPIYETENQYSKHDGNLSRIVREASKGKYVAYCEGDDYWIDENKLQMQVDFLENNPEFGMCYTKARQFYQINNTYGKDCIGGRINGFDELLNKGNCIPTLTSVVVKGLLDRYKKEIHPEEKKWLMGDYPTWLWISAKYKIKFFDKVTACYRVLPNSASHFIDVNKIFEFKKNVEDIRIFFGTYTATNIEKHSDTWIWFYIYVNALKNRYSEDNARNLRSYFSKIETPNWKQKLYNFFAFSKLFWFLFRI